MKRPYRITILGVLIILACIGVGYISAVVSRVACENHTARALASGPMQGELFYVDMCDSTSRQIFKRVDAPIEGYFVASIEPYRRVSLNGYTDVPHVDKGGTSARVSHAQVTFPFVVRVPYHASYGSLGADGGNRYYLCFFGIVLHVKTRIHYMS